MKNGDGQGRVRIDTQHLTEDWWYFHAGKPAPPAQDLPRWLSRAITDALQSHPKRTVKATLPITVAGNTVGAHVWLDPA